MKLERLLLYLALAVLVGVMVGIAAFWIQDSGVFEEREELEYVFFVGPKPAFDMARDVLRLGQVAPGTRSDRNVTVQHETASSVRVRVEGDGSGMLLVTPVQAPLDNGSATFKFTAVGSEDAVHGEYRGRVIFIFS